MTTSRATPGAQGFDADVVISIGLARQLRAMGYHFAVRYVGRSVPQNAYDLTAAETKDIIGAGLALMVVQHCPPAYWGPTASLGAQYAAAAVENAIAAGYGHGPGPMLPTLWLDLENMRPGSSVSAINAYVNAWCQRVTVAGFIPGVYFTADCPLTPEEIYLDWITKQYWRGLSRDAPTVAVRGPCMQQFMQPGPTAGIDLDRDVVIPDNFGGVPIWKIA